jgi:hypothetical protein
MRSYESASIVVLEVDSLNLILVMICPHSLIYPGLNKGLNQEIIKDEGSSSFMNADDSNKVY